MSVDNTKAKYSSLWDIDQQVATVTASVSATATSIYTLSDSSNPSVYEAQFKPTGSTKWYDVGDGATANTQATLFTFYTYTSGGSIYVVPSVAGIARLFIYQDKVNYA